jgi:hypothetical protein
MFQAGQKQARNQKKSHQFALATSSTKNTQFLGRFSS